MSITVEMRQSEKRRLILQAARRCFIQHGFHGTGMAEICDAVDMSPGNLYRYFPSKSAIIRAIVDDTRREMMPIFEALQGHADPVEGVVRIIVGSVEHLADPGESALWMEIVAESARNREVRESCQVFDRQMQEVLRKLLRAGMRAGRVDRKLPVEGTAIWLLSFIDGALIRAAGDPETDMKRHRRSLAQTIRHLLAPRA